MADTFGKRQRAQRKKERQLNKKKRKQERAAEDTPELTDRDITRDYFDGIDPNERAGVAEGMDGPDGGGNGPESSVGDAGSAKKLGSDGAEREER